MPYDIIEKRNSAVICGCKTLREAMRKIVSLTPTGLKRKDWAFEWKSVKTLTHRDPPYVPKKKDLERSEDLA